MFEYAVSKVCDYFDLDFALVCSGGAMIARLVGWWKMIHNVFQALYCPHEVGAPECWCHVGGGAFSAPHTVFLTAVLD